VNEVREKLNVSPRLACRVFDAKENVRKLIMKKTLTGRSSIVIAGCATGRIGRLPRIENVGLAGEVTIIRVSSMTGVTNSYIITLDGQDIFGIRSGQYTKCKLNPGEYYIGVRCFGGWAPIWNEDSIKVTVTPNGRSYYLVRPDISCASIEPITEAEAQKRIPKSKYISMEQQ